MKHLLCVILLLLLCCVAISSSDRSTEMIPCEIFYEWSTSGIFSDRFFSGSVLGGVDDHVAYFDTPLFLSPNVTEAAVAGRIMGAYWPSGSGDSFVAAGFWNFNFFDDSGDDFGKKDQHWVSANLGFGPSNVTSGTPNVITGGSGRYSGIIGSVRTNVIDSDPFVIRYDLCPAEAAEVPANDCIQAFEWSSPESRTYGNFSFSGSLPLPGNIPGGVANTPTFEDSDVTSSNATGRLVAQYYLDKITTASGSFSFQFFNEDFESSEDDDWLSVNFGFGPLDTSLDGSFTRGTPNIVVGGTGALAGLVGSMRDRAINTDPLTFLYEICPSESKVPSVEVRNSCQVVYEWSTAGNFGVHNFSGSALYGEGVQVGVFDTPFFDSPDVENAEVLGRLMGYYVPNGRGATSGLWNFAFFDDINNNTEEEIEYENWIAASIGFSQNASAAALLDRTPNVIMGGTGKYSGYTGTVEQSIVSTDPFVIQWTICPPEVEPDVVDDDSPDEIISSGGTSLCCYISVTLLGILATIVTNR